MRLQQEPHENNIYETDLILEARRRVAWKESSQAQTAADAETQAIRRLVKRLKRESPIRRMVEIVLRHGPQPLDDVEPLLVALCQDSARPRKKQEAALWLMDKLPLSAEQRQSCVETLQEHIESGLKRDMVGGTFRWLARTTGFSLAVSIILMLTPVGLSFIEMFNLATTLFLLALLSLVIAVFAGPLFLLGSLCQERRRPARLRPAIVALGRLRAPESVSVLADAYSRKLLRAAAAPALSKAMHALTPDHYGLFGSKTVPNLCRALDAADEAMTEEILAALAKIGDARAIRSVQRLAVKGVPSAQEVLEILFARREQEKQSAYLLRASSSLGTTPDTLLRPAYEAVETKPEQLLRASQAEEKV